MATEEQKAQYQKDLANYNSAVAANTNLDIEIASLTKLNKELEAKIQKLIDAKKEIETEKNQISTAITTFNSVTVDSESFSGDNERKYTSEKKEDVTTELTTFMTAIDTAMKEIDQKMLELTNQVMTNISIINSKTASKTTPVLPVEPK